MKLYLAEVIPTKHITKQTPAKRLIKLFMDLKLMVPSSNETGLLISTRECFQSTTSMIKLQPNSQLDESEIIFTYIWLKIFQPKA